jgi:LysR family transcriptional regulator, nitrogen assimilation regulatory protein
MHSQHLEYFCKVAEYGSFSRAAVAIGINQSALSRHVRNLELDLGISLFYRNGRGVTLTEDGKWLLERTSPALREIALAKQEAMDARAGVVGSVNIGLTPTVGRMLVLPLAKKLTSMFPKIRLRFVEGFSAHLLEWLDNGRIDMAVLYQGWAAGRLLAEKMITEKLCLIASTKRSKLGRRTPATELANFPLILPSAPHGLRRLLDTVALEKKIVLNVPVEADSFDSILTLVIANLGCSVLPVGAIQDELANKQLQASVIVDPEVTRTLILVTPNNRPTVRGFSQIAKVIKTELRRFEIN